MTWRVRGGRGSFDRFICPIRGWGGVFSLYFTLAAYQPTWFFRLPYTDSTPLIDLRWCKGADLRSSDILLWLISRLAQPPALPTMRGNILLSAVEEKAIQLSIIFSLLNIFLLLLLWYWTAELDLRGMFFSHGTPPFAKFN